MIDRRLCCPCKQVEFSDESDAETDAPAGPTHPGSKTASAVSEPGARPPAQTPGPRKQGRPKKSTALPVDSSSSSTEDKAPPRSAPRRGRPRKPAANPAAGPEEPERMRTIQEAAHLEEAEWSVEELRASDTEEPGAQGERSTALLVHTHPRTPFYTRAYEQKKPLSLFSLL